MPTESTTYEGCPHCDDEVEIPDNKPSECPNCKKVILPCSACSIFDTVPSGICDWDEKTRCSEYPLEVK